MTIIADTTNANANAIVGRVTRLEELEKYTSCKIWLEGYNSLSTRKSYKIHLLLFCRYHNNIDPDSLIEIKPEQIRNMVLDYVIHLKKVAKQTAGKPKNGEISVNSIKTYLAGIQSFLESNEIMLNWKKIARCYPEEVSNNFRAYAKEEIAKLLSVADVRDRCLILLMAFYKLINTQINAAFGEVNGYDHIKKLFRIR